MKIAIIGAGLAGTVLAERLAHVHQVTVFEKARGPGGRMSTRRADPFAFDHGAQYFTAETPAFQTFLADLAAQDLIAPWPGEIHLHAGARVSTKPKFVAVPGMNAICKKLAVGHDLQVQTRIEALKYTPDGWHLQAQDDIVLGPFDWVISTAPAVQTADLMPIEFTAHDALSRVRMMGCFTLMLGFETPLSLPWTALKSAEDPIGWMAVEPAKPGRSSAFGLVVQSSNQWADAHLEADLADVSATLLSAASALAGTDLARARHQSLHRWRYAATSTPVGEPFLFDPARRLAACGDWCLGGKIEAAFSSASALSDYILSS